MFDFIDMIGGWLDTLVNVISNIISQLLLAITLISQLFSTPIALSGYMPTVIGTAIYAVLLIFLIKFLLGR